MPVPFPLAPLGCPGKGAVAHACVVSCVKYVAMPCVRQINFGGDLKTALSRVPDGNSETLVDDWFAWLFAGEAAPLLQPL